METFEELKETCDRNLLSKSLLFMQRALMMGADSTPTQEQRSLLDVSDIWRYRVVIYVLLNNLMVVRIIIAIMITTIIFFMKLKKKKDALDQY